MSARKMALTYLGLRDCRAWFGISEYDEESDTWEGIWQGYAEGILDVPQSSAPALSNPRFLTYVERYGCPKCDHEGSDSIDVTILENDRLVCMKCDFEWTAELEEPR